MAKQYISIIRLFHHCDINLEKDFRLSRAKKQLLAEFAMSPGGFLEVDGFQYTRHDVFEELERPDFPQRLQWHQQIWNAPDLLQFLETNAVEVQLLHKDFEPFWSNPAFDAFLSPYLAGPFSHLSRNLLAQHRFNEAGVLLGYEDFLQPEDREAALRPVRLFMDEQLRILRNIHKENYKIMRPKMRLWLESYWWPFINALPGEFYDQKVELSVRLVNITAGIQKFHIKDCRLLSEQLISLSDLPEDVRKIIVENHDIYRGKKESWTSYWWLIWLVIIIARGGCAGGCNDRSSDRYDFKQIQYHIPKEKLDSIFMRLKDSGRVEIR